MDEEKKPFEARLKSGGMVLPGQSHLGMNSNLNNHNHGPERADMIDPQEQMRMLAANRNRLEQMDKNITEVVASIKSEITFAAKRDAQLVESENSWRASLATEVVKAIQESDLAEIPPSYAVRQNVVEILTAVSEAQAKNAKLKKEIKSKIERIGVMEARLNELSKENELSAEVLKIYEKLLGVYMEKIEGGENEFRVWIPNPNSQAYQSRVLEAKLEGKTVKGKGSNEEWCVTIERLPSPQYMGLKVGQKMYYDEHSLPNFYGLLRQVVASQTN